MGNKTRTSENATAVDEKPEAAAAAIGEEEIAMVALRRPTKLRPTRASGKRRGVVPVAPNYWEMVADYERHLRTIPRAANTINGYHRAFADCARFLEREGVSLHIEAIQRPHLEAYMIDILSARKQKPATAAIRYAALHAFFAWLVSMDELDASPMARMHKPHVPETPPPVIIDAHLARLFEVCAGKGFLQRRDMALFRVLMDCGIRRGEACSMREDALDTESGLAIITGKSGERTVPFGGKTAAALDAYLRARRKEEFAHLPELWLSRFGALHPASINGILNRRALQATIPRHVWPHLFRHTFAHTWLDSGGQEGDLMQIGGWHDRGGMARYGRSAAHARAIKAARAKKLGDRV